MFELMKGDCLELMKQIPDGSVDMILCDLPYGTTACKWDTVISLDSLWSEYKRICNGAIVLHGAQPFTSVLVCSNLDAFKYDWTWRKSRPTGVLNAKIQPLRNKEDILVFSYGKTPFFPQGLEDFGRMVGTGATKANQSGNATGKITQTDSGAYLQEKTGYPRQVLDFKSQGKTVHPTQKPVDLSEYLIRTYTHEGMNVLDNCMGSGTTGVACANTGRNFIGIEMDEKYFEIAKNRVESAYSKNELEELK